MPGWSEGLGDILTRCIMQVRVLHRVPEINTLELRHLLGILLALGHWELFGHVSRIGIAAAVLTGK